MPKIMGGERGQATLTNQIIKNDCLEKAFWGSILGAEYSIIPTLAK